MLAKTTMILLALAVGFLGGHHFTEWSNDRMPYTCQFQNMTSTFEALPRDVHANSRMIRVYIGDRVFMFQRERLTACFQVRPEDAPGRPET